MTEILTIGLLPVQSGTNVRIVAGEDKVPEWVVLGLAELSCVVENCQ
jgi:hypothetical protein